MINDLIKKSKIYTAHLSIKERYEQLSTIVPFIRLIDLKHMNMNLQTKYELTYLSRKKVMFYIRNDILARCPKIRNVDTLMRVLNVLYDICQESISGTCFPSVEKLTKILNYKHKMNVSRALKTLEKLGIIEIYAYYINEKHFNSHKKACHAYYLVPPTQLFTYLVVPNIQEVQFKGLNVFTKYLKAISDCTPNSTIYILQHMKKDSDVQRVKFNTM